jgi:hypothetical protein
LHYATEIVAAVAASADLVVPGEARLAVRLGGRRIPRPRQEFLSADDGWAVLRRYAGKHPRAARYLAKTLGMPIDAALAGRVDPVVTLPAVRFTPR